MRKILISVFRQRIKRYKWTVVTAYRYCGVKRVDIHFFFFNNIEAMSNSVHMRGKMRIQNFTLFLQKFTKKKLSNLNCFQVWNDILLSGDWKTFLPLNFSICWVFKIFPICTKIIILPYFGLVSKSEKRRANGV